MTTAARNFFISLIVSATVLTVLAIRSGHAKIPMLIAGVVFVVVMSVLSAITIRKDDLRKQRMFNSNENEEDDWEMDMTMVDAPEERNETSQRL